MKMLSTLVLTLAVLPAWGQAPPAPVAPKQGPDILFPTPSNPPAPTALPPLLDGQLYVCFVSDSPWIVVSSPPGLVKITTEAGPIRVRGIFWGGTGKTETRTYSKKWLTTVEATGIGQVELIGIPSGVTVSTQIKRQMLSVNGAIPPPPPGPGIPPVPTIFSTPPNPSTTSTATFSFKDADPIAVFVTQLDGGPSLPATSPETLTNLRDGSHTYSVRAVNASGTSAPANYTWTVTTAPPPPPPSPAPIPVAGLRVLIVYDGNKNLSEAQNAILYGQPFRSLLETKTVLGPDGKTHEYRIWPQDVAATAESKLWQDAMARPRGSIPWILVSNGVSGFEGPLPATAADAIALVNKYSTGGK